MRNRLLVALVVALIVAGSASTAAVMEASYVGQLTHERDTLKSTSDNQHQRQLQSAKQDCSNQSERYFGILGYSENSNTIEPFIASFVDHFSEKYNRCIMVVTLNYLTLGSNSEIIFDVNERVDMGDYSWSPSQTKKYWQQKPRQCSIKKPDKDEIQCATTDEWKDYKKDLMNS